jgi:hypothetical protein
MLAPTKAELLTAISARLERSERHVAKASVAWAELVAGGASFEARQQARLNALGEIWRRGKLRDLWSDVRVSHTADLREHLVLFLALDAVKPVDVPSFHEWLDDSKARESSPPNGAAANV